MNHIARFATMILLGAAVLPACAQQPVPVLIDKTSNTDEIPATPADNSALPLRERALFDRGVERPTAFRLTGQVLGMYDDDIRGAANPGGGEMTQVPLFASFNKEWGHNEFRADYTPTFDEYAQYSDLNFVSHDYDQEFIHKISKRSEIDWTARVSRYSSRYLSTTDPTRFGDLTIVLPDLQSLLGINQVVVTSAQSQLTFIHQSTPRDTFTFGVLGGTSRFTPYGEQSPLTPILQDFVDGGANLSWNHKLSEKTSLGLSVTGGYLLETSPSTHELDETIQATLSHEFAHWKVNVSGGPLIRQVPPSSPYQKGDNYVVNVIAGRKIHNSTVNFMYSRSLQMGFVDGSVLAHTVSGFIRQNINPRFFVGAGGSYNKSDYPSAQLNGFIATGQVGYHVSRNLIFLGNYCHAQQDAMGNLSALGYQRNQYSAGLSYDFTHLLPRWE